MTHSVMPGPRSQLRLCAAATMPHASRAASPTTGTTPPRAARAAASCGVPPPGTPARPAEAAAPAALALRACRPSSTSRRRDSTSSALSGDVENTSVLMPRVRAACAECVTRRREASPTAAAATHRISTLGRGAGHECGDHGLGDVLVEALLLWTDGHDGGIQNEAHGHQLALGNASDDAQQSCYGGFLPERRGVGRREGA